MTPSKLLNYLLQNLETSNNVIILCKIFKLLKEYNTKLVLYNFDSFLFDFDRTEKKLFNDLKNIFSERELKIKISYGVNYSSLQPL